MIDLIEAITRVPKDQRSEAKEFFQKFQKTDKKKTQSSAILYDIETFFCPLSGALMSDPVLI